VLVHGSGAAFTADWPSMAALVIIGAIAGGINSVAGGGSFISFPFLTGISLGGMRLGFGIPLKTANATNAVALWPGSLTGALGFWNVLPKTAHYLKPLWLPTLLGSAAGAWMLIATGERAFEVVVPVLLLLATLLLAFQPQIRAWAAHREKKIPLAGGVALQFMVALYGGYFGAGMGIMMLAVFTLYMEGNIHEINAVKSVLGLIINFIASLVFLAKGMIWPVPAIALTLGSIAGGFYAAKYSQLLAPEKLRIAIAAYGFLMTVYFAYSYWL
jgi:uncharacterized membrane protein YfcA